MGFLVSWAILSLSWEKYVNDVQIASVSQDGKHGIYFIT